jgi:hypothetical protein
VHARRRGDERGGLARRKCPARGHASQGRDGIPRGVGGLRTFRRRLRRMLRVLAPPRRATPRPGAALAETPRRLPQGRHHVRGRARLLPRRPSRRSGAALQAAWKTGHAGLRHARGDEPGPRSSDGQAGPLRRDRGL